MTQATDPMKAIQELHQTVQTLMEAILILNRTVQAQGEAIAHLQNGTIP
jgi:hypothetical protein